MNLVRARLAIGEHPIEAYVARTQEQRAQGLMHRAEMGENEGMLFVCDECAPQSFWMKDTPLALSIAFLEEDGTIVQLDDMEPNTLDSHRCEHPVRYVLEMPMGWFSQRGVGCGEKVTGPVFVGASA